MSISQHLIPVNLEKGKIQQNLGITGNGYTFQVQTSPFSHL